MPDDFQHSARGLESPATFAFSISKSDVTELPKTTRGIYVGGTGDLVVKMAGDGSTVTFTGVQAGSIIPIRANFVMNATTATSLVGLH